MKSEEDKKFIANKIKSISIIDVDNEMNNLIKIGKNASTIGPRSRIGNNIVDYFTFLQRLETKGKYDTNFFEFFKSLSTVQLIGHNHFIISFLFI